MKNRDHTLLASDPRLGGPLAALMAALTDDTTEPAFQCDCMLGGLSRWLRAAGYDARWKYHADDRELVREARAHRRILATGDSQIMERRLIRLGRIKAIYIPHGLSRLEMLQFTAEKLALRRMEARCMSCGGRLESIPKEYLEGIAPPKAYARCDHFYVCGRCSKLLWNGTHWKRITEELDQAFAR